MQPQWLRKIKATNKVGFVMVALLSLLLFVNLGNLGQQFKEADFYVSLRMHDAAAKKYEEILKQESLNDYGRAFVYWAAAQSWHRAGNIDNAAIDYLGFIAYAQDLDTNSSFYIDNNVDSKLKYSRIMLLGFWMSKTKTSCMDKDIPCKINNMVDIQVLETMVPFCEGGLNKTLIKGDNNLYTVKAICESGNENYYFFSNEQKN